MVGTIISIGYGEGSKKSGTPVAAHLVGSLIGGLGLGFLMAAVHEFLVIDTAAIQRWVPLVIGLIALGYGLDELSLVRLPRPQLDRQVPRGWSFRFRPWTFSFGYGLVLGFGVSTRIHAATTYAAVAYGVAKGGYGAFLVGGCYGIGRALPIVLIHARRRFAYWKSIGDVLDLLEDFDQRVPRVRVVNGLALASAAAFFVAIWLGTPQQGIA